MRKVRFIDYGKASSNTDLTVGKVYAVRGATDYEYVIDDVGDKRIIDYHEFVYIDESKVMDTSEETNVNNSGGSCGYYQVKVEHPVDEDNESYMAECYDLIKALKLTWEESNIFKEIWRTGNARNMNGKEGNTELRAAEKIHFFAQQNLNYTQMENK